ncbi:ABC transporter permease [Rhodobacter capsulatus]|uniref:Nitrate/sulfonate/bicarbonate ABC transporter, permease protein n=1 Tax=Rhodobacter capsulatus (strain ATCC BAA-309 / NBRC 16581 / SB1003) TaxID=272942 RepID=D5AVH8_RHOCB|nr:ABC transporter permease subunit [Rhodobacter capsulatus]ADE87313.1 nitrate/sulfonate/bicarbonate ABC transporter, permease protein [Rhodobacter capsulatus SB 1003]ETE52155.1 ABC transporter permease [Rhodobacter capsulatus Y262]MDS0926881.1 ABC transporter permease subunit [Rhodobacter capsulatus]
MSPSPPAKAARLGAGLAGAGLLLLLWEVIARQTLPAILPGPLAVGRALIALLGERTFWTGSLAPSLAAALAGVLLALFFGLVLGWMSFRWPLIGAALAPLRLVLMGLPAAVLAILLILWLEGGGTMVVAAVSALLVPVFQIATTAGLGAIDPQLDEMARLFHVPRLRRLRHVLWPALATALMPALRVAVANGLRITLLVELLGGGQGLGRAIQSAQTWLMTDRLLALTFVVLLMIAGAEALLALADRRARRK